MSSSAVGVGKSSSKSECVNVVIRARPPLAPQRTARKGNATSRVAQSGLPPTAQDWEANSQWYTLDPTQATVQVGRNLLSYSDVFGPEATQEDIYNKTVGEVLDAVLEGFNGAVFAYGVTGSGKTYTMMGNASNRGIIPQSFGEVFYKLKSKPKARVSVSFLEIYGKKLVDLLNTDTPSLPSFSNNSSLEICGNSSRIHVRGIKEVVVKDESQALEVLEDGCKMLHFRQTECNESSSRSHAVFTISYTNPSGRRSKLVLVDLAGSENVKRSKVNKDGVKEAGEINTSLSVLGRVVEALNSGSSHIPYRESLLTRLLQDSLGGNCKTCMIATINPERRSEAEYRQTMSTLQFSLRMSKVVNRPKIATIDNTERRLSLTSGGFDRQELEETMTRTMEEFKSEFKGWRENLENLVSQSNRKSLTELEEVKRIHEEKIGAKEQHIEDVKTQLADARNEINLLRAEILERSQEAERNLKLVNERHRTEMRELNEELVLVATDASAKREAANRLETELAETRSQASRLTEFASALEVERAEARRLRTALESMKGKRDNVANEAKALSESLAIERLRATRASEEASKAQERALEAERTAAVKDYSSSMVEEVVRANSDTLERMRYHYENMIAEMQEREASFQEGSVRASQNVDNRKGDGGSENGAIEELTLKLTEAQQMIAFDKIELDRVRAECDAWEGEYERAMEAKDEQMMLMRVDAKREKAEKDQLQSKLVELECSLSASEVRVGELTSQVESLQLELESSQALVEQLRVREMQSSVNLDQQRTMREYRARHSHNCPAVRAEPTGSSQSTSRGLSTRRHGVDVPAYHQPELLECVDHLETALHQYNDDRFSTKAEKMVIRELKKIYGFASESADELFPLVYHLLVEALLVENPKLSQLSLQVLSRLCWNSPINRARCVVDADQLGLPEVLATILEGYADDERLVSQATKFMTVVITQAWRDTLEDPHASIPSPYCSIRMLRALLVPLAEQITNADVFAHTCFCIYGFIQYYAKRQSPTTTDEGDPLIEGITILRQSGAIPLLAQGITQHYPERITGFAGMQALQAILAHSDPGDPSLAMTCSMAQHISQLALQVMSANPDHADTQKHCVLLLELLLGSDLYSEDCAAVLRSHPSLERTFKVSQGVLRERVTSPEMAVGQLADTDMLGENTRLAMLRVEADDDNKVYRILVKLGRFFGVALEQERPT